MESSSNIYKDNLSDVIKRRKKKTRTDFDYKYIANISCESKKGEDNRILGSIMVIFGIVFAYLCQGYVYGAMIVGAFFVFTGIMLFLTKIEPRSILKIQMSGVTDTTTITMIVSASQMDEILQSISVMRERTEFMQGGLMHKVVEDQPQVNI